MSRIRKLSEGSELPLTRLKHRNSSKSINYSNKNSQKLGYPYSKVKPISRSPSYLISQATANPKPNFTVRSKSKNTFRLEDHSLSAPRVNSPWDNMLMQAKQIREKLTSLDQGPELAGFEDKLLEIFDELIEKDLIFAPVLFKIKGFVTSIIRKFEDQCEVLHERVSGLVEEKQNYVRMLDRLSTENIDLGKEIQRHETNCSGLQRALDDIQKVSLAEIPINGDKWKALIYENSQYSELVQDMKLDIREFQYKEDQLIRLVGAIKARGVPVDDIYEEDVKTEVSGSRVSESIESLMSVKVPLLDFSKMLEGTGKLIE